MEEMAVNYFQGLNFMSKKVMQDGSSIMMKFRDIWQEMSLEDREKTLNEHFIPRSVKEKYVAEADNDRDVSESFPVLKIMGGEKIVVDFDNEDVSCQFLFCCFVPNNYAVYFQLQIMKCFIL